LTWDKPKYSYIWNGGSMYLILGGAVDDVSFCGGCCFSISP